MDNRIKDNKLEQDLKTIVECEADSAKDEGNDDPEFEANFGHLELRSHRDIKPNFENMKNRANNNSPLEENKCPLNLFGSRTYTSPGSFDSSSRYSCPFRNELSKERRLHVPTQKFTNNK